MYLRIWEYLVEPAQRERFEQMYGAGGEWAALFGLEPEFRGTQLFVNCEEPGNYVTVDRWSDEQAWDRFNSRYDQDYRDLGSRLESLTLRNTPVISGSETG